MKELMVNISMMICLIILFCIAMLIVMVIVDYLRGYEEDNDIMCSDTREYMMLQVENASLKAKLVNSDKLQEVIIKRYK